jgi:hypothetical protein
MPVIWDDDMKPIYERGGLTTREVRLVYGRGWWMKIDANGIVTSGETPEETATAREAGPPSEGNSARE